MPRLITTKLAGYATALRHIPDPKRWAVTHIKQARNLWGLMFRQYIGKFATKHFTMQGWTPGHWGMWECMAAAIIPV